MRRTFAAINNYNELSINTVDNNREIVFYNFTEFHCRASVIILEPEIVHLDGKVIVSGQGYKYAHSPKFLKLNSKELEYIHPHSIKEKRRFLRKQKGIEGFYLVKTDKVVKTFNEEDVDTNEYP